MNSKTFDRYVARLCKEIEDHPHKDEIVALATEQLIDDNDQCFLTYRLS